MSGRMPGRMPRSMAGLAGWMQGCPGRRRDAGQPVSVEELKRSPASKPCVVSVRESRCEGRAGSQEHLPSASSLCLLHIAMAGWRSR